MMRALTYPWIFPVILILAGLGLLRRLQNDVGISNNIVKSLVSLKSSKGRSDLFRIRSGRSQPGSGGTNSEPHLRPLAVLGEGGFTEEKRLESHNRQSFQATLVEDGSYRTTPTQKSL